ncbi:uncharacterized protein LOC125717906 isoform X2 [Brienomyrus brachyistius]|uniref:uncharacterized protein LOC125717906 isoform X2 n=1 Tax=Brienomyrus brachyistius TaxID=42636 RepID=UPI0020B242AA|nr:uncharacterized protein LOC125717906 isoform X2 [Brienomyrus brachyistius]
MKRRKVFNSEIATRKRPKTKTFSKDGQLIRPVKGLSKAEIQDLIQKEILAKLKQSDEKMDELIGRIQKIELISSYEGRLYKLQADIKKIKRRGQAALVYMRKLQPSGTEMSPEELNQRASFSSMGSELSYTMDSAASVHVPPGLVPSETTVRDHTDVVSSTGETQSNTQGCAEVQEETEEVIYCGVMLPKTSTVEGSCQKQLKGNPAVDLTSESKEEDTAGALNSSREGNDTAVGPSQMQPLKNTKNIHSGVGMLRQSTPEAPPHWTHAEGDWLSKQPPLPAISLPNYLLFQAEVTQPPQKLGVEQIERPEGIGLQWTAIQAQPCTFTGQFFPLLHPDTQLRLIFGVEQHRSDQSYTYSHDL